MNRYNEWKHTFPTIFQLSSSYLLFLYCPLRIHALVIHTSCRNALQRLSNHPNRKVFIAKENSTRGSRYRPKPTSDHSTQGFLPARAAVSGSAGGVPAFPSLLFIIFDSANSSPRLRALGHILRFTVCLTCWSIRQLSRYLLGYGVHWSGLLDS